MMFSTKIFISIAIFCIGIIPDSEQCGDNVTGTSGSISSPNYPGYYSNNLNCNYAITTPENTYVLLTIVDFSLENGYDYVTIYDGPSEDDDQLGRYTGSLYGFSINASTNEVLVRFTTDSSGTYKGFNITYEAGALGSCGGEVSGSSGYIQSPNYPGDYPDNSDCYYSLSTPEDTTITLEIVDLDLEPCCDFVEIYDGPTEEYNLLETLTGDQWNGHEIKASTNQALVYFHTDASVERSGFNIKFTESVTCEEEVSGTYGAIISPGYPVEPYPNNQNCYYKVTTSEGTAVTLDIIDMELETGSDYIIIYNGPTTSSPKIGNFTGVQSDVTLYASSNQALLYFHTDSSVQKKGFYIYFEERDVNDNCPASTYTDDSGVITSPLYPEKYPNSTDCSYSITTSTDTQIILHANDLQIDFTPVCSTDYVEIFDGPTANRNNSLGKFCGIGPVNDVISSTNEVFVQFHSDDEAESKGFNITYSTNPCPETTYFYRDFGTIYSPGFPLYNYPNFANCNYSIELLQAEQIHITVVYADISSQDYLRIYPNGHGGYYEINGTHTMEEFQLSTYRALIEFHSDGSGSNGRGFVITYASTYYADDDLEDSNEE